MAKTTFTDGNPSMGILGTRVLAAWLNKVFSHRHTGQEDDGYAPKIDTNELSDSIIARLLPTGTVIHTATAAAPTGFLKANGALVSRVTYGALFAAIGITYGAGDGVTTFALPDLRGEFLRGLDDGRGIDAGRALGSAQASANLQHNHSVTDPGHLHAYTWKSDYSVLNGGSEPNGRTNAASNTGASATGITINNSGTTESRPRNIALLACIKF